MNKEFLSLMFEAKKLEIEALRGLLPPKTNRKIDKIQKEVIKSLTEGLIEFYKISLSEKGAQKGKNHKNKKNKKKVNIKAIEIL
ncbi:MAG: hypothetical protein ACRCU3_07485 [Eubacteriaceae bacterium]